MTAQPAAGLPTAQPPVPATAARVPAAPTPVWQLPSASARMVLAGARQYALPEPDRVVFEARCPSCGDDASWTEERDDTRVRIGVDCACA
ncbi:MAG: hypothetical protein U0Q15_18150 [Kineosporiaceae bacterium]